MRSLILTSQTMSFNSALYEVFFGIASPSNLKILCVEQTQTECVREAPAITHSFCLSGQKSENPICTTGYFSLNIW